MALQFPTSSVAGQTYQSGSSAVYQYDGEKWIAKSTLTQTGATTRRLFSGSLWTVDHNLGTTTPVVDIYSGSVMVIPQSVEVVTSNVLRVTFPEAVVGTAVVSTGIGGPTSASYAVASTSATSASYADTAVSASALVGNEPIKVIAGNNSAQTLQFNTVTTITNWQSTSDNSSGMWNPTTGGFTANRPMSLLVVVNLLFAPSAGHVGAETSVSIAKDGVVQANLGSFTATASSILRATGTAHTIIELTAGQTITVLGYQNLGGPATLHTSQNYLTITEIPSKIQR